MFNWLKKEKHHQAPDIRDTLFGDMPLAEWPGHDRVNSNLEPWTWFIQARNYLDRGDKPSAVATWQKITEASGLESRHYLQAWHFLRQLGVAPPAPQAKMVYGVVVEVKVEGGLDILAAYTDYKARYLNYGGAGVIWEAPDDSLNSQIDDLLQAAQVVVHQIGPWEGARPAPPPGELTRLNMLTPSGLHFGQGDFDVLANEPKGRPIILAAIRLMQSLIAKDPRVPR